VFPNLHIYLTLPTNRCIKNNYRSTSTQENLITLSSENDIFESIDFDETIKKLAYLKARKKCF